MDVHRGARICSAAHGGQVFLSGRTAELVAGELPEGVGLLELGEHRLKDLADPVDLFQLVIDGLRSEFPRVRSLGVATNLLSEPTSFVGRERERTDVTGILRRPEVRLLTLTGPGGTGKTRLAVQVATGLLDEFVNGVFLVSLGALADERLVPQTIATALGISDDRPPLEAALEELDGRSVLLVLDNFEHVLEAAPVVSTLLASSRGVKALATSREPLHLTGEHEYAVPALTADEAVELFAQRARAVQPDFAVTVVNRASVDELCRRIDRLPLAVELAAPHVRLFSPAAMLDGLDRHLDRLRGGPSDMPARHQALWNTIGWSYDLLDDPQKAAFRALAVFVGGCTLEAAGEVVPSGGRDPLDVLERLARKSLVYIARDRDGLPRFRMLETIRAYAARQLEANGERDQAHQRFADYVLALVERAEENLRGADQLYWAHRLDDEFDNVRSAVDWTLGLDGRSDVRLPAVGLRLAGALGWYCYAHGHVAEGRRWLDAALARTDEPGIARAKALHGLGVLVHQQGDQQRAIDLLESSLALYREAGARSETARELNSLGAVMWAVGDLHRARALLEESLALRRRLGELRGVSSVLSNLAMVAVEESDAEAAGEFLRETLEIDRQLGDAWGVALTLANLGAVDLLQGDLTQARRHLAEALRSMVDLGDDDAIADCLEKTTGLAVAMNRMVDAVRLAAAANTTRQQIGVPMEGPNKARLDKHLVDARAQLGHDRFVGAWTDGAQLDLEAAVQLAIELADRAP